MNKSNDRKMYGRKIKLDIIQIELTPKQQKEGKNFSVV